MKYQDKRVIQFAGAERVKDVACFDGEAKELPTTFVYAGDVDPTKRGGKYTLKDMKTFYERMKTLLGQGTESVQEAMNIAGFMVLNMIRITKKGTDYITLHMIESASRSYTSLYAPKIQVTLPPPCSIYVRDVESHFSQSNQASLNIYALCVSSWLHWTDQNDQNILGVLKAGCMLSLSENGLGLIGWVGKAAETFRVDPLTLLKHLFFSNALKDQAVRFLDFF